MAVTGRGYVTVQPDRAVLSVGVSILDRKADSAREEAANAMQDLIQRADALGILPADHQTGTLRLEQEYDYSDGAQKLGSYRVTNTIIVKARAIEALPSLVDGLLAAAEDAGVLRGIDFDVEDRQAVEVRALEAAVADARSQAEALARASGLALGGVRSIDARQREARSCSPPRHGGWAQPLCHAR